MQHPFIFGYLTVGVILAEACRWNKRVNDEPRGVEVTRWLYLTIVFGWPWHTFCAWFFRGRD